jgi:hypothetical protein
MESGHSVTRLIKLLREEDKAVREMAASLIWQRYFETSRRSPPSGWPTVSRFALEG